MSSQATPSETDTDGEHIPQTGSTTFITTSGGLLTEQLVSKLRQRQTEESAVRPETFALPGETPPSESELENEIGDAWNDLRERWDELTMNNELFGMDVSDARNKWILNLFRELDFEPVFQRENLEAGGLEANLSHKGWPDEGISNYGEMEGRTAPILHAVKPGQELDEKPEDAPRGAKSPHDTLQEFLNASDDQDWAVVTNGLTLRVLRDYYHTYTRGYVEFDLENMFTNRNYGDFRALYRLCHASRFIEPVVADEEDDEVETPLEQLYQVALSTGVKVGQDLQENVVSALETLGNGFLNSEIEAALEEGGQDAAEDYYQDLLYVVYRVLFLMFAEQRGMMSQRDSLYTEEYSITKLRERAEQREQDDRNSDLWEGLKATFELVGEGDETLSVPGYNGDLFDDDNLEYILDAECPNGKLLSAVDDLTHIEQKGYRQRISYADLGVEEIGAVYESLLEFTPQLAETVIELEDRTISSGSFYLDDRGMERKETGSFYTDPGLIDELIQSSLEPVVEDRVDDDVSTDVQEQQLLDITVCDPACGSGAFLIAANNYLGQKLAEIRSDSLYPDEKTIRQSRRSVVQHCIYGVDLNPMAVELAKVSLWINSAVENKPLSFLDHRIKQGNSLIGTSPELLSQGVPVDAYETSKGREWHKGNEIRKRVRQENDELSEQQQQVRLDRRWGEVEDDYVSLAERLNHLEETEVEDVHEKEQVYQKLRESKSFKREKLAYDVWTAAFYWPLDGSADEYPTPNTIERIRRDPPEPSDAPLEKLSGIQDLRERASRIADEQSFFHWPLEFPQVFSDEGGFDCLIGNPPWDVLQVKTKEFFAVRAPEIVNAKNQAERERMIENLESERPELYKDYKENVKRTNQTAEFVRHSGRYPLTGSGEINIYAPFAEHFLNSINDSGRSGVIVPTGIATESKTQDFFRKIIEDNNLVSLYGFVNSNKIFEGVDSRQRFCLLTLSEEKVRESKSAKFAFYLTKLDQLQKESRVFELSPKEIETINPNTKTCPIFTNRRDAELILKIHNNSNILVSESEDITSPWDVDIYYMYHMSSDSNLFNSKEELENEGWKLQGNIFEKSGDQMLPLYEAKLFHQYDHRFASFEDVSKEDIQNGNPRQLSQEEKSKSGKVTLPRYWVNKESYRDVSGDEWHLALRRYARSDDRRTTIATILPEVAAGDSVNIIRGIDEESAVNLLATLNSFTLDYVMRQKHGGAAISQYLLKQLPIPEPKRFEEVQINGISASKRLEELVFKYMYPSRELESFVQKVNEDYTDQLGQVYDDRRKVRAEIEAIICRVYNLNKSDIEDVFKSFGQIKSIEMSKYGEFKTREEVLTAFEAISSGPE